MAVLNKNVILLISLLLFTVRALPAQNFVKSTGIGIKGSFYNPGNQAAGVYVSRNIHYTVNSTGNTGGYLLVYSRFTQSILFEFSIGNIAAVEDVSTSIGDQKVSVFNMTPILFGLRYDFLQDYNPGFLQPYLITGFGGYVFSDVIVDQGYYNQDVAATTKIKPGIYFGIGLNVHMGSWIAFNIDGRYHMININPNFEYSGSELSLGFIFSWGNFK